MKPVPVRRVVYVVIGTAWAAAVGTGLWLLWGYAGSAGAPATPPAAWPGGSVVRRSAGLPTLVLLAHPRCPCSRATVEELARLMAECHGRLTATVLMLRPAGVPAGWERTGLWDAAAAIPGASVVCDEQGRESRRFGATTSGQAILYGADGGLLFAGGITESRGHGGDNAGRSAVAALVLGHEFDGGIVGGAAAVTPVYGCPLFDEPASARTE